MIFFIIMLFQQKDNSITFHANQTEANIFQFANKTRLIKIKPPK